MGRSSEGEHLEQWCTFHRGLQSGDLGVDRVFESQEDVYFRSREQNSPTDSPILDNRIYQNMTEPAVGQSIENQGF